MQRVLQSCVGLAFTVVAFGALYAGLEELGERDYLAAMLVVGAGLALLRGGVDLLRPTVGE